MNIPRFAFEGKVKRAIQQCDDVLRKLTKGDCPRKAGYIIAQFQQMMDQGIIGIYSFIKREGTESFFMKYVKPGEMSLTIYPKRIRDYISVFREFLNIANIGSWIGRRLSLTSAMMQIAEYRKTIEVKFRIL